MRANIFRLLNVFPGCCVLLSYEFRTYFVAGNDALHYTILSVFPLELFPLVSETACLNGAFRNSVLVLNFNFDQFYSSVPLLYDMYDGVFARIVTCGPEASKLGSAFKPDIVFEVVSGHFSYRCVGLAVEKYPGYEGLFFARM